MDAKTNGTMMQIDNASNGSSGSAQGAPEVSVGDSSSNLSVANSVAAPVLKSTEYSNIMKQLEAIARGMGAISDRVGKLEDGSNEVKVPVVAPGQMGGNGAGGSVPLGSVVAAPSAAMKPVPTTTERVKSALEVLKVANHGLKPAELAVLKLALHDPSEVHGLEDILIRVESGVSLVAVGEEIAQTPAIVKVPASPKKANTTKSELHNRSCNEDAKLNHVPILTFSVATETQRKAADSDDDEDSVSEDEVSGSEEQSGSNHNRKAAKSIVSAISENIGKMSKKVPKSAAEWLEKAYSYITKAVRRDFG